MAELSDRVLILRHRPYREQDVLLTCFGQRYGKVSAVAKSARSPKSRLGAGVQGLALAHLTLYRGRSSLLTVTDAQLETIFPGIRRDLDRTGRAAMLADMVDELCSDQDAAPGAFAVVVEAFGALDQGRPPTPVFLTGFWQLMREAGLKPDFHRCQECDQEVNAAQAAWRTGSGPVCQRCWKASDTRLPAGALIWLRRAESLSGNRLGLVTGSASLMEGLEGQAREHFAHHVGRLPRAFRFWDQLGPMRGSEGEQR